MRTASFWRSLLGILGFIPSFFCSLRDGRRHEMGSLAHFEYLLRIESVLMNGEVLICDSGEVVSLM